jgi:hypothetical protein
MARSSSGIIGDGEFKAEGMERSQEKTNFCPFLSAFDFDDPFSAHAGLFGQCFLVKLQFSSSVADGCSNVEGGSEAHIGSLCSNMALNGYKFNK